MVEQGSTSHSEEQERNAYQWKQRTWLKESTGTWFECVRISSGKTRQSWNRTWKGTCWITRVSEHLSAQVTKDRPRSMYPSDKLEGSMGVSWHGKSWGTQWGPRLSLYQQSPFPFVSSPWSFVWIWRSEVPSTRWRAVLGSLVEAEKP